jgi:hypothetical protein
VAAIVCFLGLGGVAPVGGYLDWMIGAIIHPKNVVNPMTVMVVNIVFFRGWCVVDVFPITHMLGYIV